MLTLNGIEEMLRENLLNEMLQKGSSAFEEQINLAVSQILMKIYDNGERAR